jgi:hypothetical protein
MLYLFLFLVIGIITLLFNHGAHKDIDRSAEDLEEARILSEILKDKENQ